MNVLSYFRILSQWKIELEEIIQLALNDSDQWVTVIGDILKTYPATGSLNCDIDDCHTFFHEVINDVKKQGNSTRVVQFDFQ
jgi:negative elongation factor A